MDGGNAENAGSKILPSSYKSRMDLFRAYLIRTKTIPGGRSRLLRELGIQVRVFKAEPSIFAVISTMGMTRS